MRPTFGVAWYRFQGTFHRRRGGYLAIVLLIGLVGGIAMRAIAGPGGPSRRTRHSGWHQPIGSPRAADYRCVL